MQISIKHIFNNIRTSIKLSLIYNYIYTLRICREGANNDSIVTVVGGGDGGNGRGEGERLSCRKLAMISFLLLMTLIRQVS